MTWFPLHVCSHPPFCTGGHCREFASADQHRLLCGLALVCLKPSGQMRISFLVSVIVPRGPTSSRYPILPQGPLGTIVAPSLASLWLLGKMKSYGVVCVEGASGWGSGVSEL